MIDFTTASRSEIKIVYDAIATELGDDRFFTTKELDVLPKILSPFEQVLSFSSGLMDGATWLIVLTDQRVLFVDKGMIFGLKQTSIDLENIVSIDGETGLMFGVIRISSAAGPREIRNVWKRTVNPFVNRVRLASTARRRGEKLVSPGTPDATEHQPTDIRDAAPEPMPHAQPVPVETPRFDAAPSQPPVPTRDSGAELARLERLRNAGSIDEAEYQRQRAQLK